MVTVTLVGWRTNTELVFLGLAGSVAAASSPVLPCLVSALLCPLWEGGSPGVGLCSGVPVPPVSHLGVDELVWSCLQVPGAESCMGSDGTKAVLRRNGPKLVSFVGVPLARPSPGGLWVQLGLLGWVCWSILPWCLGERKRGGE